MKPTDSCDQRSVNPDAHEQQEVATAAASRSPACGARLGAAIRQTANADQQLTTLRPPPDRWTTKSVRRRIQPMNQTSQPSPMTLGNRPM